MRRQDADVRSCHVIEEESFKKMSFVFDRQNGRQSHRSFLNQLKNSSSITRRLILDHTLNFHHGCVNTICWNENGTTILSGSDDQCLIVTDPFETKQLLKIHSGHRENIFSAKFLPETNDKCVVSCSGDGVVFHTDFERHSSVNSTHGCFTCHGNSTAYEVRVFPRTPNLFLSCSDDGTIRLFDLRTKSRCLKELCQDDILIRSQWEITSFDINPLNSNEILCACADSSVRLYDHRKLSSEISSTTSKSNQCASSLRGLLSCFILENGKQTRRSRITSVVFNSFGNEILASFSSKSIFLLDPRKTLTHDQLRNQLAEQNTETNETKSSNSSVKRFRLGGDWSDTGPDARPSNENEPTESTGRNVQNFFMQRMSEILTQLVSRTTSDQSETTEENPHNIDFFDVFEQDDDDDVDQEETENFDNNDDLIAVGGRRRASSFSKGERLRKYRQTERSHEENYLQNVPSFSLLNSFDGHRNVRTMIKEANFWSDKFVMSGSDCGHIFIWDKFTGEIVRIIEADEYVVNCVQPHPLNYPILASSGIDYNVKLFSPLSDKPIDDRERIPVTVERNRQLIKETSSTIAVPTTFMLQILRAVSRSQNTDELSDIDDEP